MRSGLYKALGLVVDYGYTDCGEVQVQMFGLWIWRIISDALGIAAKRQAASRAPSHRIAASKLLREYMDNKVRADATYKGQVIEVHGRVGHLGDALGAPYIALDPNGIMFVQCLFVESDRKALAKLDVGDIVTVRGKALGRSLITIALDGCTLV